MRLSGRGRAILAMQRACPGREGRGLKEEDAVVQLFRVLLEVGTDLVLGELEGPRSVPNKAVLLV